MEWILNRTTRTEKSTIGSLTINGKHNCYILEDKDRGLHQDMRPDEIARIKVHGRTAIPAGRYEVVLSYSNRFKRMLPLLLNVPGFSGIRIHPGNTAADTEGCPLTGNTVAKDFVGESVKAFSNLFVIFKETIKREKVFITIR